MLTVRAPLPIEYEAGLAPELFQTRTRKQVLARNGTPVVEPLPQQDLIKVLTISTHTNKTTI
jgi:hypothetical protein